LIYHHLVERLSSTDRLLLNIFETILLETWQILAESAPFVLFGFLFAGLLKALLPDEFVARHLGGNSTRAVIKASLLGIPLPLCSCGVIPAAVGLRRQGASRGASAAFLVSTPESGVDSIAITWALLDPVMTVVRPLAAFVTATLTGILINHLPEETNQLDQEPTDCADSGSCCGTVVPVERPAFMERARAGVTYAFGELLKDIGSWLLLGVAIAGVVSALVPDGFFAELFDHRAASLLVMLVVGIPLYMCASASTPIAAALVLKGLSPGAALVFLLAGPATNAATITIVARYWGRKATVAYLSAIAICSLALGWLLDLFYDWSGLDISRWVDRAGHDGPGWWGGFCAVLLLGLILRGHWLSRRSRTECGCS
jgi:uncharacterized membrane protein YraQ (UPF0718 family)